MAEFHIRPAQAKDLQQVARLDRIAFVPQMADSDLQTAWYPDGLLELPGREVFVATQDSEILAGVYIRVQLPLFWEGQEIPAVGLSTVAVAPEYRGQGVARTMLQTELSALRSQHVPLVMLYPFQQGFYRQLGWAWVGRIHQYNVAASHLPLYPDRQHLQALDPQQAHKWLPDAYQRSAKRHNGWLNRRAWQWDKRLKLAPGQEIFGFIQENTCLGYLIISFQTLADSVQPPLGIHVDEWVALNGDAYRGLLGFLGSLRDQVATVTWNTYPEDPFPHLLREQRRGPGSLGHRNFFGLTHRFGEIGAGQMWRLVDIAAAFRLRAVRPGPPFMLTFEVNDPILGTQTITANFAAERMHPVSQPTPIILKTSVEHLTEMFCGLRRATELAWTKEVELEGDRSILQKLDQAWDATPPFCWDFF
jgi:predicted acetyltransferase